MTSTTNPSRSDWPRLRAAAAVVGAVFLVVGVAGFVPGLTSNVDQLEFAGHMSDAELFGLFQVSILHNIVHLAFGVLGLLASRNAPTARLYLIAGGAVYLLLWIYGLVVDQASDANFVPLNDADNWLHLGLGVGMVGLGVVLSRELAERSAAPAR